MSGEFVDLENDEYRAHKEAVSISELGLFHVAPVLYKHFVLDGHKRFESSKALELGTAVHAAVLEPKLFERDFMKLPEMDLRFKANKDYKAQLEASNPSATILSWSDYEKCEAVRDAVRGHKSAGPLLAACDRFEQSFFWDDPDLGVKCKGRADAMNVERGIFVDLKTTKSVAEFSSSIANFGYHRQAAFYMDGATEVAARNDWKWYWIIVEPEAPYLLKVVELMPRDYLIGRSEYKSLLSRFRECKEQGVYPGYPETIEHEVGLPSWYVNRALAKVEIKGEKADGIRNS